ncbi:MAG: YhjD/YihY/BrkB family envelope integrity protein, partial [Fibrobacteria bacterium]
MDPPGTIKPGRKSGPFRTLRDLVKETFSEWQKDNASRLAAALSYYTIFSVAPLLIIAIAVAGLVFGRKAATDQLVGQIRDMVGNDGAQV